MAAEGLRVTRPLQIGSSAQRRMLAGTLGVADLAGVLGALGLAALAASGRLGAQSLTELWRADTSLAHGVVVLALLLVWRLSFVGFGLYDGSAPLLGARRRRTLLWATALNTLVLLMAAPLLGFGQPAELALLGGAFSIGCAAGGAALRKGLDVSLRLGSRRAERRILVVGTNPHALGFARRLEAQTEDASRVIGFVDKDWPGMPAFRASGGAVVCDLKNLDSFVRQNVVDEIVIAAPLSVLLSPESEVIEVCREHGIATRFLGNVLSDLPIEGLECEGPDGDVLATARNGAIQGWPAVVKRAIDFSAALVLLGLLAPVFAIMAVLVATTSRGPVFFGQDRVGLNKRRFKMLKFRTMVAGAEDQLPGLRHLNEAGGPVFKLRNDPRITWVGRFARTWSLDELPQLLNVLKGDMSLVGPRPLPFTDFAGFEEDRHRRRLSVPPGITCLWQVSGRSSIAFDEWMELDLEYIDRWSLALDLEILARTLPAVLRREGAE